MTGLDKLSLLTALGSVFLVVGADAKSAAPITPVRFNSAYETQANRWHQSKAYASKSSTTLTAPLHNGGAQTDSDQWRPKNHFWGSYCLKNVNNPCSDFVVDAFC